MLKYTEKVNCTWSCMPFMRILIANFSIKRQIDCSPLRERQINAYKCIIFMDDFITNLGAWYLEKWKRCFVCKDARTDSLLCFGYVINWNIQKEI